MKKTYVLDTNVLLSDPNCIHSFEDNDLIIPVLVLEELDKHKVRSDEVGRNARQVARLLDSLRPEGNFNEGIPLRGGGRLKILSSKNDPRNYLPTELTLSSSVDNMIIGFMLEHKDDEMILVSKDINVRIKCDALGLRCQDYLSLRVSNNLEDIYSGVRVINVGDELVDRFYADETINVSEICNDGLYPNQIVVLKSLDSSGNTKKSALGRCYNGDTVKPLAKYDDVFGLKPRNKEQIFSMDLLMDPSIKLVTITGKAGNGKTILAIAAGLEQLNTMGSTPRYQKLVISRPVQPVGRDIGFLPGTLQEKMEPWIAPIKDNLEFLLGTNKRSIGRKKSTSEKSLSSDPYLELLQSKGLIEVEAISFIRGRSIPNSFIIIDEAQNLSVHELKTIITRAGEGTKVILTGDIEQIDNVDVDTFTNGLTYAVEKFKEYPLAAHVTLLKGERSELATLASKIL